MTRTIATTRGWPAAILVALISFGCFAAATSHLFRHAPSYDELLHVIAARGVNATGEPVIQDGVYDRASIYTRIAAWQIKRGGDEVVAARVPAWVSAGLLVLLVALWTARTFGPSAGLFAGVLLALSRITIEMSVFARFYTLHALLMFVAFACLYAAAAQGRRMVTSLVLIAMAGVAFEIGWLLQGITAIGAGALLSGIVMGLIVERRDVAVPLLRRFAVALAILIVAGIALLYWLLNRYDLLKLFTDSALWAAHAARRHNFYNQTLGEDLPLFWPLVPFAFLAVALRNARLGWSLIVAIVAALLLQSIAAQKATRYVYYILPFICVLLGCGLSIALAWLRHYCIERWPAQRLLAQSIPAVLIAVSFGASTEAYRYARAAIAHDPPETVLSYGAETSWAAAKKPLEPYLRAQPLLVASNSMKAIYYFGWYDAELNASIVGETETQSELGLDERTGRRALSTVASLDQLLAGEKPLLILVDTAKLGLERGVPAPTVVEIERRCRAIELPLETGLSAWTCPHNAAAS